MIKVYSFISLKFSFVLFIYPLFIRISAYKASMFEALSATAGICLSVSYYRQNGLSKCGMLNLVAVWQPPHKTNCHPNIKKKNFDKTECLFRVKGRHLKIMFVTFPLVCRLLFYLKKNK